MHDHHNDDTDVHIGGIGSPDPFARPGRFWPTLINAVLATALFRCWHILIFFAAWSTAVSVISATTYNLGISPTLLTVLGTVLGFVISYRTTSSFERYNEGRRYWSQIVLASRTFVRLIWIHVPETMAMGKPGLDEEEIKARVLVEKKTVVNLVEAFAVAVKHYLRGEEGVYYEDLYHLVKFLPAYALPAGLPSVTDFHELPGSPTSATTQRVRAPSVDRRTNASSRSAGHSSVSHHRPTRSIDGGRGTQLSPILASAAASAPHLPLPATSPLAGANEKLQFLSSPPLPVREHYQQQQQTSSRKSTQARSAKDSIGNVEDYLLPARNPPQFSYFDVFPFSLLVHFLTKRGKDVKGKKGARLRAKLRSRAVTHNLPHEISLYLSSYVAALQARKAIDPPTTTTLIGTISQLVDALTGLERILTTPIPFSYSIHLWAVTLVYCFVLPFQLWLSLKWLTIPGTIIASFIFFGFLVAGEEIENPFGYDKNDLNMDYFTHNIIRDELRAITATPAPNPADWAFSSHNDCLFSAHKDTAERLSPEEWVRRGKRSMLAELAVN